MANKLAIVTGNWLTAGTWVSGNTGTNAVLVSTSTSTTNLTTSNLDSATFTPANQASQYLAIRLAARAAGSPTNKMTVILRNNTTSTDVWTFVINVSDIPLCDTTLDQGGWLVFKAAGALTPNGTDTYFVRCKLDSTSTAVALSTNGTANNWQRQMFQTATSVPTTGDDMLIAGVWDTTNPAVKTDVTVTMNETAATDYGSNTTNSRTAALNICKGGTLTSAITAATAYKVQLSGHLVVYIGGTLNQGTTGAKSPRDGSSFIDFDCTNAGDFGLQIREGTWSAVAEERLAGVTNTVVLLTVDKAAAATSLTTSAQLGAANGDEVVIASTSRTGSETEIKTLNANAGATSLSLSAGLTNAHSGTSPTQAEVSCLTRTVGIRGVTATKDTFASLKGAVTVTLSWALLKNAGRNVGDQHALCFGHTSGTVTVTACVIRAGGAGFQFGPTSGTNGAFTVTDCVTYGLTLMHVHINGGTLAAATVSGLTMYGLATSEAGIAFENDGSPSWTSWTNTRIISMQDGIRANGGNVRLSGQTFTNTVIHSNARYGLYMSTTFSGITYDGLTIYRTSNHAIYVPGIALGITIKSFAIFGCNNTGLSVDVNGVCMGWLMQTGTISGDSTFAMGTGMIFVDSTAVVQIVLRGVDFGASGGIFANHTTADVSVGAGYSDMVFDKCPMRSTTELLFRSPGQTSLGQASVFSFQDYDASAGVHRTYTKFGTILYDTTTVDVSPSVKLTPLWATVKLDTSAGMAGYGFYVPVDASSTPTVSIKIQKDGSYNGNAPRLMLRANHALGVLVDTVIGTFSGASGSFQTVSGTAPSAAEKGVMEFYVDCDGTAGNIYVDTFVVTNPGLDPVSGLSYWFAGLPC